MSICDREPGYEYFSLVVRGKTGADIAKVENLIAPLLESKKPLFKDDPDAPLKILTYCHANLDAKAAYSDYLLEVIEEGGIAERSETLSLEGFTTLGYASRDSQERAEKKATAFQMALEREIEDLETLLDDVSEKIDDDARDESTLGPLRVERTKVANDLEDKLEMLEKHNEEREAWYLG